MIVVHALALLFIVLVIRGWARCGPDEDLF